EAGKVDVLFDGHGHAPSPPVVGEEGRDLADAPEAVQADLPDWLVPTFHAACGDAFAPVTQHMKGRGPIALRVNLARTDRATAQAQLADHDIETMIVHDCPTALIVTQNPRRVANAPSYLNGDVEMQDVSSQRAVLALGIEPGMRVLDYCAGGGGKALAMAALGANVTAHDIEPSRMSDLPTRAARAGADIEIADARKLKGQRFDLVLCDAPCSGSGTWRRTPEAKWALTSERLEHLIQLQRQIMKDASTFVRPDGVLAYATCSILRAENEGHWPPSAPAPGHQDEVLFERQWLTDAVADGFYLRAIRMRQQPEIA
ncbi:MAG: RsmB/NOP family class I SAM-dependent RNA methyltransferase, partial [Pseudomonadota bacterium]